MWPSDTGNLAKRRLSRDSGAEPPGKTPKVSPMPKEKNGLFVLHDRETAIVDIVAVHGLCGDPYETWTEETSGKLWLRDFLPSQVANTRIMSYGYDSSVAFSKSGIELGDVAADLLNRLNDERGTPEENGRPVIFICHSLGGIVVKKALILAHERSGVYGGLLQMVKAVIFMGTPHRGADGAFWANFTARALEALGATTNRRILSELQKNSGTLGQISQQFVERGSTLQMKTFYETIKLDYMSCLVVEKDSAILNLPTELPAAPIYADHRSMCKFASRDEQKYKPVWKAVEHFVKTLGTQKIGKSRRFDYDPQSHPESLFHSSSWRSQPAWRDGDRLILKSTIKRNKADIRRGRVTIQTILSIIGKADPDQLLRHLPAIDQEFYKSHTCPSSCDQPKFYWIFKNMDFERWQSTNGFEVLWLSGPADYCISDASSRIVDLAKESYPEVQHSVLYFFCATAPKKIPIAITFVSTSVRQLVHCSPNLKREITTAFLSTLLDTILKVESHSRPEVPLFNAYDSAEVLVKKILQAPIASGAYWAALKVVLDIEPEKALSLIIDGLDETEHQDHKFIRELRVFIGHLRRRRPGSTTRVLLTSGPQAEVKEILGQLPSIEYDKERKECLNSLRFDNTRSTKISEQHEGSLEWLWGHEEYLAWSSTDHSDFLLIEGKPGSGKSTLMKYFQRSLLEREPLARRRGIVASFYYSYREGEKQTNHFNMLRSVLYDVLNQSEEFFFHFQSYYRQVSQGRGYSEWSIKSMKGPLLSLTKSHPVSTRLYLILDAMDESDGGKRIEVIKFLHELCAARGYCIVKVFVASRPIVGLGGYPTRNHKMIRLQDVNHSDILRFTESFLCDPELDLEPGISRSATEYITTNAQGVFIWVHLVKEELVEHARNGCTENEIFDFLKSLPTELEGIYQLILMRLEGGRKRDIEVGQKMLQLVLFAYRPLGLDELKHALAIQGNLDSEFSCCDESFQRDLILSIEKRIISCAGNLLEIKAQGDHEKDVVQVMHQTVREFFRPDGPTAQSTFRMKSSDTHMIISMTCIRYLMLCTAKATSIDREARGKPWTTKDFEAYAQYLNSRPFFNYALEYAERHQQQCGQVAGDSVLISQLHKKLNDSPAAYMLGEWIPRACGYRLLGHKQVGYSRHFRVALLHAATRMRYPQVVEALLIAGAEVEACLDGKTPLMVTAGGGDLATARVLLDGGALVGARDGSKQEALHLAAANGHSPIVGLLIDRGAEMEAKDDKGQTALHLAAANGHDLVVGLLIDRGADKEAKEGRKQTALHLAAWNGHNPVVEQLIDRGADKEAKDGKKQTALHFAAGKGHDHVVGQLIDRGADKEARDEEAQTALHHAAANGHNAVIKLLIDRGADKNTKDALGWEVLHTAAWNNKEATIQMLIKRFGTNKEGRDKCGWTALHVAAINGCDDACQRLIGHLGADKKVKDDIGWTPLHFVAALGLGDTAHLLIKAFDVDRGIKNSQGKTARDVARQL